MLIINKKYPPDIGGIEIITQQTAQAIAEDENVDVIVFNNENKSILETQNKITITKLATIISLGNLRWSTKYKKTIKEVSAKHDVILFNYPSFQPEISLVNTNAKMIVYYHADNTKFGLLGVAYQRIITRRLLNHADLILVSNPNIIKSSNVLAKYNEKCKVLSYGIDTDVFYPRESNVYDYWREEDSNKVILFVGRMARYKGMSVILEALNNMDDCYKLAVVSNDSFSDKNNDIIQKYNLASRIMQFKEVSYEDLPNYYSCADVLIMPSTDRAEAFGLVAVESLCCGTPVITTELGTGTSYHNIDGITGRVIDPNKPDALMEKIIEITQDTLRYSKEECVRRGHDFSIKKYNESLKKIIKDII